MKYKSTIIMFVFAIASFWGFIYYLKEYNYIFQQSKAIKAKVSKHHPFTRRGSKHYSSFVRFKYKNEELEKVIDLRFSCPASPCYKTGEELIIYYSPKVSKHTVRTDDFLQKYTFIFIFIFFTLVFTFGSIYNFQKTQSN